MATAFEAAWLARQADLDVAFGETFAFTAISSVSDLRPLADTSRPAFSAVGRRTALPRVVGQTGEVNAEEQAHRPGTQGQSLHVSFGIADLDWTPTRGDRALATDTNETLTVSRVEFPGRGRLTIVFSR